ncbi:DUF7241 domain-containing protein [Methylorubrum populi]
MKHVNRSTSTTRNDQRHAAEVCREHGWREGTRLVGSNDLGTTVIEIMAVSQRVLLARTISQNHRQAAYGYERSWRLSNRDWHKVP